MGRIQSTLASGGREEVVFQRFHDPLFDSTIGLDSNRLDSKSGSECLRMAAIVPVSSSLSEGAQRFFNPG
jgi:hypothetical protein